MRWSITAASPIPAPTRVRRTSSHVAARGDVGDRDAPGEFGFFALALLPRFAPPPFLRIELFDADGFGFVVALHAGRIGMFVGPDFFCRLAFGEEEEVGFDPV